MHERDVTDLTDDEPDEKKSSYAAAYATFKAALTPTPTPTPKPEECIEAGRPKVVEIKWTERQRILFDLAPTGDCIFVTGPAGTGKSAALKELVKRERERGRNVAVTGLTGIAAVALGGTTIHSFAGIGLGNLTAEQYIDKLENQRYKRDSAGWRWCKTDLLIIDEISMCSNDMWVKLDRIARHMRKRSNVPFGGLQIIVFGDFNQLEPIEQKKTSKTTNYDRESKVNPDDETNKTDELALFETKSWMSTIKHIVYFKEVFRQADTETSEMLNRARRSKLTSKDFEMLEDHVVSQKKFRKIAKTLDVEPTYLHPHKLAVKDYNNARLKELVGKTTYMDVKVQHKVRTPPAVLADSYTMYEKKEWSDYSERRDDDMRNLKNISESLMKQFPGDMMLRLKIGSQVMLVQNLNVLAGLANGSRGKVIHIGASLPDRLQPGFTANLAAAANGAVTANSATTLTNTTASVTLTPGEAPEPSAVAAIAASANAVDEEQPGLPEEPEEFPTVWVQFEGRPDIVPIRPFGWKRPIRNEDLHRDEAAWREWIEVVQMPLILCWALTIHKAQGQSLKSVYLYLGPKIRSYGQAYVAISRVISLGGLYIEELSRKAFRANPKVLDFEDFLKTLPPPTVPKDIFWTTHKVADSEVSKKRKAAADDAIKRATSGAAVTKLQVKSTKAQPDVPSSWVQKTIETKKKVHDEDHSMQAQIRAAAIQAAMRKSGLGPKVQHIPSGPPTVASKYFKKH